MKRVEAMNLLPFVPCKNVCQAIHHYANPL
jgi:hypothetical protein